MPIMISSVENQCLPMLMSSCGHDVAPLAILHLTYLQTISYIVGTDAP